MRVELLATLKSGKTMYYKGQKFSDPLPNVIAQEVVLCRTDLRRQTVMAIEDSPSRPQQPVEVAVVEKTETETSVPVQETPKPIRRRAVKSRVKI